MYRRQIPILTTAALLAATMTAHAEDCSLRGDVRTPDGAPVGDITISVMAGRFRPSVAMTQSQADGSFEIAKAPCGRVNVSVFGMPSTTKADTRRPERVSLTVPQSTVDYARRMADLRPAQAPSRPLTAEEAEDVRLADEFRARTIAAIGTPLDRKAFEMGSTAEARMQAFSTAVARWLQAEAGFGASPAGSQVGNEKQARLVRTFVANALGEGEATIVQTGSPRERTRVVLTATRQWLTTTPWPNTMLVMMTNAVVGDPALRAVREILGPDSEEVRGWADHLSPRWRGDAYRKALLVVTNDGLEYLNGRPVSQALTRAMAANNRSEADMLDTTMSAGQPSSKAERQMEAIREAMRKDAQDRARDRDRQLVMGAFGPKAAESLGRLSDAEASELRLLATLYMLGTSPAFFP